MKEPISFLVKCEQDLVEALDYCRNCGGGTIIIKRGVFLGELDKQKIPEKTHVIWRK